MISRRGFLVKSVAGGVSAYGVLNRSAWAQPVGANDAIRVAVVGVHGKGNHHLELLKAIPGVRIVAICDIDQAVLDKRAGELAADGIQVAKHVDMRKLLESKDIDAVTIATPNHWHSLHGRVGAARPARTSTSRSPSPTTCGRGARSSRPLASTTGSSRRARSRGPTRRCTKSRRT